MNTKAVLGRKSSPRMKITGVAILKGSAYLSILDAAAPKMDPWRDQRDLLIRSKMGVSRCRCADVGTNGNLLGTKGELLLFGGLWYGGPLWKRWSLWLWRTIIFSVS